MDAGRLHWPVYSLGCIFSCASLQVKEKKNWMGSCYLTYLGSGKQGIQSQREVRINYELWHKVEQSECCCWCVLGRRTELSHSFGRVVSDIYHGELGSRYWSRFLLQNCTFQTFKAFRPLQILAFSLSFGCVSHWLTCCIFSLRIKIGLNRHSEVLHFSLTLFFTELWI